jgi:hypothetical protein
MNLIPKGLEKLNQLAAFAYSYEHFLFLLPHVLFIESTPNSK